jgi:hypothetical protein
MVAHVCNTFLGRLRQEDGRVLGYTPSPQDFRYSVKNNRAQGSRIEMCEIIDNTNRLTGEMYTSVLCT